ncbi:MAG: amidohydrolase, partial [Candidatus Eiseniibacteriota bacterium]
MKRADEFLLYGATLLDASRAGSVSVSRRRRPASKKTRSRSEAVWIRGSRIEAVGSLGSLRARAGRGVTRVDLGGGTLTPGFTDSHIHLVTWIRALREPWLNAQTVEAVEQAARERMKSAPREEWILLRGFVPRDWPATLRVRATLDRIAPDRPLVLHAVDGHSVWGNRLALERAGIDARTPEPSGGTIERDREGGLTGVLIEEARKLLTEQVRRTNPTRADLEDAIAEARSLGITSAHDFDRRGTWRAASELARDGALGLRLLASVPVASLDAATDLGLASGFGGDRLRVGPVKMFADGTLGSATALLEAPYEGSAESGIEVT